MSYRPEPLEPRRLLAAVLWDGGPAGTGTEWTVAENWSNDVVPTAVDDVTIPAAAGPAVRISSGTQSIHSLVTDRALTVSNSTLAVATTADVNATLALNNGTLGGGSYDLSGGSLTAAGTVDSINRVVGLTVASGDVVVPGTLRLRVEGGLAMGPTATIRLTGTNAVMMFIGSHTFDGHIRFENPVATGSSFVTVEGNATLTLGPNARVTGGRGELVGRQLVTLGADHLVNHGVITADVPGTTLAVGNDGTASVTNAPDGALRAQAGGALSLERLTGDVNVATVTGAGSQLTLSGTYVNNLGLTGPAGATLTLNGSWRNAGGLNVAGGTLNLGGAFTTADLNLPAFSRSGGSVNLTGTLNNTGATLTLNAATGPWNLNGGTLHGGTLVQAGVSLTAIANPNNPNASALSALTLASGDVVIPGAARLRVLNGLTTGAAAAVRLTGTNSVLMFDGTQTFDGNIRLESTSGFSILTVEGNSTLTLAPGARVSGGLGLIADRQLITAGADHLVNHGTITADVSTRDLIVGSGGTASVTNLGTFQAQGGGRLVLDRVPTNFAAGTLTGGTWRAANGVLRLTGINVSTNAADIALDGPNSAISNGIGGSTSTLGPLATNAAGGTLTLSGGRDLLTGGNLTNNGTLRLGPGSTLSVPGDFTQGAGGSLGVDIAGVANTGLLTVTGAAVLDGTLDVSLVGGFLPASPHRFTVLTFGSRTRDFAAGVGLTFAGGVLVPVYGPGSLTLVANLDPVASPDTASTLEDHAVTVNVLANDTDPDHTDSDPDTDPPTVFSITQPAHGSAVLNADGTVTYTPDANYNGPDSFTYTLRDVAGNTDTATVSITGAPVNDAPSFTLDAGPATVNEDSGPQTVSGFANEITAGPADEAGQALTFDLSNDNDALFSAQPAINPATGDLTFTPAANGFGTAVVTAVLRDNGGTADGGDDTSEAQTFTITVNAVADDPVAADDAYSVDEDQTLTVAAPGVLANDSAFDGSPLSAAFVSGPAHGTLLRRPDGSFEYTPSANFNGTDSFTYRPIDGATGGNVATVTITVAPVNDAPVADDDTYATDEDTPLEVPAPGVLDNDTDVDGDTPSAVLVAGPAHGSLTLNADGSFRYAPDANYGGPDSFTYRAVDGSTGSNVATAQLTVRAVNDAPVAADDSASTSEDTPVSGDVLANDSDVDSVDLEAVLVDNPAHGMLSFDPETGGFTYTPDPDYHGPDGFTYRATDGLAESNLATVSIAVTSVGDAPVAVDDTAETDEDQPVSGNVLANDTDADGDDLDAVLLSGPAHGALAFDPETGAFTYTPDDDYNGRDSFTYRATDGGLDSGVAAVAITVAAVNDAPRAGADAASADEDQQATGNVLSNDTDADGDDVDVVVVNGPSNGTLNLDPGTGAFTYTPDADFFGTDGFTYRAVDATSQSGVTTVTITVREVNDAPVAFDDAAATTQGAAVGGNVLANDIDPDNVDGLAGNDDVLTTVLVTGTVNGTLALNPDGTFTYTPDPGFSGNDSFTYRADDGQTIGNVATVTITVASAPTGRIVLMPDACHPGMTALVINGTPDSDVMRIETVVGGVEVFFGLDSQGVFAPTGRVVVYGLAGNDLIRVGGAVPNESWLYGDGGYDGLLLGGGGGIAFGGDGFDALAGGAGRDVLIGGQGADGLVGNAGDDILISGVTIHDDRSGPSHEEAWCAILDEWSSSRSFAQRADNLRDGTGTATRANGAFFLNDSTVLDDSTADDIDLLAGGTGNDWFFYKSREDRVLGMSSLEGQEDVLID